jgi:aminopeptidase
VHRSEKLLVPTAALKGAHNAVKVCLAIGKNDKVVVITDSETEGIGNALMEESEKAGAAAEKLLLEDFGQRPFTSIPEGLAQALRAARPSVTFYAAQGQPGEISFRIPLRHLLIDELNVRHGHMIGIDEQLMAQGMLADYQVIYRVTQRVTDLVRNAGQITVTNPKGTAMRVAFSPDLRWKPCHGLYHSQGDWGNLPEGETFTCPANAEGVIVADVLGDYFSQKYGILEHPATFMLSQGKVVGIRCEDKALERELRDYISSGENGDRVGEFAIGTNLWVRALTGNLLQDEKIPGVHVAFGDPYPEETGANWSAQTHMDVIPTDCNIEVDGKTLMQNGRFVPEVLEGITGLP